MALTVYTSKDNAWREYVNPLRGMTLERIVQLIEQDVQAAFSGGRGIRARADNGVTVKVRTGLKGRGAGPAAIF